MKNLILYEKGDKVSLTPAYVAMRAIEESKEDVEELISLSDYTLIGQYVGKYAKK